MAKIVMKDRHMAKRMYLCRTAEILGGVIFLIFGNLIVWHVKFIMTNFPLLLIWIFCAGLGLGLAYAVRWRLGDGEGRSFDGMKSGVRGETKTKKLLRKLPKEFTCFQGLVFEAPNREGTLRQCEIDFLLIGPTGLYIIEVKNYGGILSGSSNDPVWKQTKAFFGGHISEFDQPNPLRQVKRHYGRLKTFLAIHGLNPDITTIVYCSNPDASVRMTGKTKTHIFTKENGGGKAMLEFIRSGAPALTKEEARQISDILDEESRAFKLRKDGTSGSAGKK